MDKERIMNELCVCFGRKNFSRFMERIALRPHEKKENIELFASMVLLTTLHYPSLYFFELALKSRSYYVMTAFFAKQLQANDRSDLMPEFWYYWMPKDETTKSNVTAVMKNLKIEPTTEYAQSAQIAYESLHLGTVIHLLSEQKQFSDEWHFWTYVVKDIFPYYKQSLGHGSRRERIFQALRRVNTLRNNIFHFDPAFMFDDVFGGPNHERYKIDARYLHAVTAWLSVPTKLLLDQMVALLNTPLAAKAGEESPLPLDLNKVFIEFEKMEQVEKTINNKKERSRR